MSTPHSKFSLYYIKYSFLFQQLQQSQEMNARRFYENFLKEANENIEDHQIKTDHSSDCFENDSQSSECNLKTPKSNQHRSTVQQTSPRTSRRTKIRSERYSKHTVLTDKCSNFTSCNLSNCNSPKEEEVFEKSSEFEHNYQPPQQHQQQDKRDILLKIRQQIFERKRLRQVLNGGGQRQSAQHPFATHQHQQQQQQHQQKQYRQTNIDYNSVHLERQDALQQLADVWRPW